MANKFKGLRYPRRTQVVLLACIVMSLCSLALITVCATTPWYEVLSLHSTSPSWQCDVQIMKSAFYGFMSCDCDEFRLGGSTDLDSWCTNGFYDWRSCDNCNRFGCGCAGEQKLWDATMAMTMVAWASCAASTVMLFLQISDKMKAYQTQTTHTIIHYLNFNTVVFLTTAFLLFLGITRAVEADFTDLCTLELGACDEFMGEKTGEIMWENFFYTYTSKWGPEVGWWSFLGAIPGSVIVAVGCFAYTGAYVKKHHDYDAVK